MKKRLALLLAAAMCLQPLAAISISAEGESAVEKVYADVYGIEIDFTTADAATAAESGIALAEGNGGAAVAVTAAVSADVDTKVVVTPNGGATLDVDTPYTLTIGGETKDFQIKTMFYEDFEDLTYDTPAEPNVKPGENIAVSKEFTNSYGKYSLTAGDGGAFVRVVNGDTEVGVTDGAFAITDIDTFENLSDATLMADIKGYAKRNATSTTIQQTLVNISMLSRSQTTSETPYTKASKLLLKRTAFEVKTTNAEAGDVTGETNSSYVNHDSGRYEFGKLVSVDSGVVTKDTAVDGTNESNERAIALRTNGTTITGFADVEAEPYTNASVETTAGDFVIGLTGSNRGLAVIDNVRVTMYTEDLSPAPSGTISEPTLDGDTTKLTLDFNEELTGIGPVTLDTITVLEDDIEVDKAITVDETDKSILYIVPDGLAADKTYTVIIPNGFGVGDLRVEEAEGFTLPPKYIEPTPMAITDKALTSTSINITFDKDISTMTTTEEGYVRVYKKALGADDSAYAEIPYADITFTKEGNVLKIAPNTFAVDNTYKVVVAQGYGDANVKVTAQTADEYVVDFVKTEAKPTRVSGNFGFITVEFDRTIESAETTGVKIFNAQTGVEQTGITATFENGILNVAFPGMVKNVEYEIFIPEGFGTNAVGTKKDFRKKFKQEIVGSENFEGETVGATIPGAKTAITQEDRWDESPTPNHRGYMASGRFDFTTTTTYNEDGTVKTLGTQEYENITLEFKHQALYPIRDNTAATAKKYGGAFVYDYIRFNYVDDNNYHWLYFNNANILLRDTIGGTATTFETKNLPYDKSGDAYKIPDGSLFVYKYGEEFSIADPNYPYTGLVKRDGTNADVTASAMDPKDGNTIRVIKTGNTFSVYLKNASGVFEQKITPKTMNSSQKKGAIAYVAQGTTYYTLDDIEISAFKVYDETGITVAASSITPTGGDWTTATTATGEITFANYTDTDLDMAVVAVAYGANGKMLGAYYNDTISEIAAGGRAEPLDFTLNNLGGEAVSVKVFIWDNTSNRAPMSVYELIDTE